MDYTKDRRAERVGKAVAEAIVEIAGPASLITVTGVRTALSLKSMTILVTVLPAEKEAGALEFLKRNVEEIHEHVQQTLKIGGRVHLSFEIDQGEKNRQRLEELEKRDQ